MASGNVKNKRLERFAVIQRNLVNGLRALSTPALGPDFGDLTGPALADALVAHRLTKHFAESDEVISGQNRRDSTIAAMLRYDVRGITSFDYRQIQQPVRGQVLTARNNLATFFKGLKRSHCFRAPTGETCWASGGYVDLLDKLLEDEQWLVSIEAASEAAAIAYNNTALKREVKRRFRAKHPMWQGVLRRRFYEIQGPVTAKSRARWGFDLFRFMFLNCCTIQNYSRLSTVPKNATVDRPISMEPLWNMIVQLSFAQDLREHLRVKLGINLDSLAALHRTLIRHASCGTVDFSNASNSNWTAVLKFLMPPKVYSKLMQMRTPICFYKGKYHYYNMLAPMGCGFTFEVMTIVLLHLGLVFDKSTSVFGDDVIMKAENCDAFIGLCTTLGWKVNVTKTFTEGNFRESCGGFHDLSTKQDLLSYEMHAIEDDYDACTTANKLFRILQRNQVSKDLRLVLYTAYSSIVQLLPSDVYRAADETLEVLPSGVVLVDDDTIVDTSPNPIESCLSTIAHAKMRLGRQFVYRLSDSDSVSRCPSQLLLSAFLRRGESYTPKIRGSNRLVKEVVIAKDNGRLASMPLFSFI